MENLTTKELILDLSTDISRVGLFTLQNNQKRIDQFMKLSRKAVIILSKRKTPTELQWVLSQLRSFTQGKPNPNLLPKEIADDAFTYSNILMHRSVFVR